MKNTDLWDFLEIGLVRTAKIPILGVPSMCQDGCVSRPEVLKFFDRHRGILLGWLLDSQINSHSNKLRYEVDL